MYTPFTTALPFKVAPFEERNTQGHTYVLSQLLENAATHAVEHLDAQPQGFSGVHSYGLDVYGDERAAQESLSHIFALLAEPNFFSNPARRHH